MMNAMLAATMTLGNVFLFVFLLLFTFALLGLQIFRDNFRARCVPLDTGLITWQNAYGFAGCSVSNTWPWDFLGPTLCDANSFCADVGVNPYADTMVTTTSSRSAQMHLTGRRVRLCRPLSFASSLTSAPPLCSLLAELGVESDCDER